MRLKNLPIKRLKSERQSSSLRLYYLTCKVAIERVRRGFILFAERKQFRYKQGTATMAVDSRVCTAKAFLSPQWLLLPILGESHGGDVYVGKVRKQLFQMHFHIVAWRYNINKPFQYAYIVEYTIRTNSCGYPWPFLFLDQHR